MNVQMNYFIVIIIIIKNLNKYLFSLKFNQFQRQGPDSDRIRGHFNKWCCFLSV